MLQFFGILGAFVIIWGIFRIIGLFRTPAKARAWEGYSIVQVEGPEEGRLQLLGHVKTPVVKDGIDLGLESSRSEEYYFFTGLVLIALGFVPMIIQMKGHIIIPRLQALLQLLRSAL